ncbi:DUF177 domain-containing protein [Flammeovirgaceae bacterium SG7u.111]|nr:DUF177 domain-containing protein [Flammeovirgaceae bacterium SG7u.132]WPO38438.1 DUF177 domain-containing protein [Flammeovirgaceae bacterium SG7u.111]
MKEFIVNIVFKTKAEKEFVFDIEDSFFEHFGSDLVEGGKLEAKAEIVSSATMLETRFDIKGTVKLLCDRSLEPFDFMIETQKKLFFKFGESFEEMSDEIIVIPQGTYELDLSQYLYDFIMMCVPAKKIHPKYAEDSEPLFFSTDKDSNTAGDSEDEEPNTDPRWDKLKNLKF